jgi:two-component system phosphate regulon sensor histidine kinase PhoR
VEAASAIMLRPMVGTTRSSAAGPARGIRTKLFLASLGLMTAAVLATDTFVTRRLEDELTSRIRDEMLVRLALVARDAAEASLPFEPVPGWDELADDLGVRARGRVTFIRKDGLLLGDSQLTLAELPHAENHATRPEVIEALRTGSGSAQRLSVTIGQRLMYVAVPLLREGQTRGVARLAVPLSEVDEPVARLRRSVSFAATLALGLAVVLAMMAAQILSGRVRRLTEAARRMAEGDLEGRAPVRGNDELASLGGALNQLVESLARTLAQLRSERDVVGRVFESMREGVMVVDARGRVAMVNPALRDMLLLRSDIIGKPPLEATGNLEVARALEEAAAGEGVQAGVDVEGLKPRRLLVTAGPLPGEAGGLAAVFVDVTEMQRLETMRRDFVANVSHELRTPLAAVLAATETLQGGAVDDARSAREFLAIIERNVQRLQRLLEDVLDLSRIEARELRLELEPLELAPAVQHVLGMFSHQAERKQVGLRTEIPAAIGAVVADRSAFEHVLSNLVDNAVKYCPAGATVTVRAQPQAAQVRVAVADSGPGIDRKHLPRLFERFYRVDSGRSREVGGTGLGLSIVKHLVEAMGGSVSVESDLGRGTTFMFTLPRV